MRALNLGAGRAQFPITDKTKPFSEHNEEFLKSCPEAYDSTVEWINIDRIAQPGIDKVVNLFRYPWVDESGRRFESDSVDIIWCSHIVEHIPHAIKLTRHGDAYLSELFDHDGDGWFAFFYEVWRILKPGGRLHVLAPYAWSNAGVTDPTHTRMITTGSFGYFSPSKEAPFDYDLPYRFRQKVINGVGDGQVVLRFINDAHDRIRKLQDAVNYAETLTNPDERKKIDSDIEDFMKSMDRFIHRHINQVEDIYIVLEAVK